MGSIKAGQDLSKVLESREQQLCELQIISRNTNLFRADITVRIEL